MRLTLRTLLAYMDGMLDQEDTEALAEKIEESKFAPDLIHRIRNASRQLRLGAPKADAKGANDANLVADYLDGTLTEDRVAGFEGLCLESDLNLSEVAACHQILTLVLGEPADVSASIRQRIHDLPKVAEQTKPTPKAPPVQGPGQEANAHITKEDMTELVGPRRSWTPIVAVVAIVVILLALLRLWGPFDNTHPALAMLGGQTANDPPADVAPNGPNPSAENGNGPTGDGQAGPGETQPAETQTPGTQTPGTQTPGAQPAETQTPGAQPAETQPPETQPTPPQPGGGSAAGPKEVTPKPATSPSVTEPAPTPPPGSVEKPVVPPATTEGPAKPITPTDEGPPKVPPTPEPPKTDVATPTPGKEVGRYTNTQQLLLRRDPESGAWMRVAPASMLRVNDQLACPPNYRPSVAMVNGVQLIFAGRSNAVLQDRGDDDTPTVRLDRGRVMLVTSGRAGAAVRLAIKDRVATVTFGDVESAVGIEVRDYIAPGADLASLVRQKVIEVIPLGGSITWSEAGADHVLAPGQVLAMTDTQPVRAYALPTTPEWTDMKVSSTVAALAAKSLEPAVVVGRPAQLSLQEKVGFRQQETVALAIDSLCQLGSVEPAIRAFGDDRQHAYWPLHVDALRNEIARSNEAANGLQTALTALESDTADKMLAMIVGYSSEQLAAGKAKELVDELESDKMPLRVLAYENLKRITGRANFYQAQKNAERQKDKIRFWKELLERGQITYPVPPSALPNREPLKAGS